MALLTEEQIKQLVEMATVPVYLHDKICEWNEKQTTQQFEPDWSAAPKYAVMAAINLSWLSENGCWSLGYRLATYDRPPLTPHPHAEMMAKYAEVAARRVDPWVEFEFKCDGQGWAKSTILISFYEDFEYRYIGDDK